MILQTRTVNLFHQCLRHLIRDLGGPMVRRHIAYGTIYSIIHTNIQRKITLQTPT
jgi:hypothetical protein